MTIKFLEYQLDTDQFRLLRGTEPVHVEPLIFDLIVLFAENSGKVVDKEQMIEVVWQGRFISDATLSSAVKAARKALGDSGEKQQVIQTVRGRGFRFLPDVQKSIPATPADETPPATDIEVQPKPGGRPSLAVLPFSVLGAQEGQAGIDDAIAHDLIGALSRARWMKIIARGSSFRFRGADVSISEAGRTLGVRYCLTGTLEFMGARLALSVELIEAEIETVIWADRYEGALDDIHHIRADIVKSLVTELEGHIQRNEALQAMSLGTEMLDAWQAFHLGLQQIHLFNQAGNAKAEEYFTLSAQKDPTFARAHAGLSYSHFQKALFAFRIDLV